MPGIKMKDFEFMNTKRRVQSEETKVTYKKWDDIKNTASSDKSEISNCHSAPMIWIGGGDKKEVGVCSKCRKLAFNKSKIENISYDNKYQNFRVRERMFTKVNQQNYNKGINTQRDKSQGSRED